MTEKQKVYIGFVCLEENLRESIERMIKQVEDYEFVDINNPQGELPSLKEYLEKFKKEEKLIPEKPLWVLQQENKKLWRK